MTFQEIVSETLLELRQLAAKFGPWISELDLKSIGNVWIVRVIFALALLLISEALYAVCYNHFPKRRSNPDVMDLDFKLRRCAQLYAVVVGFFTLSATPNAAGESYSLPMALRTIADKEFLMEIWALLYIPLIVVTLIFVVMYLKAFRCCLDVIFDHLGYMARGMLISQGVELVGWLLSRWYMQMRIPSGSLPYFLFYGLLIAQIIFIAGMVLMSLMRLLQVFGLSELLA